MGKRWIVGLFLALYAIVSSISSIHSVQFFELSNPTWLAISLAVAFEVGAACCLAGIAILERVNRWIVFALFALITAMQVQGNCYYAFSNANDISAWCQMFGLSDLDRILQLRVFACVSGGLLPIVAIGFIKSLIDYLGPRQKRVSDVPSIEPMPPGAPKEDWPEAPYPATIPVAGPDPMAAGEAGPAKISWE